MVVREVAVFYLAYPEKLLRTSELPVEMAVVVDGFFEVKLRSDVLLEVVSVSCRMDLSVKPPVEAICLIPDLEITVEADPTELLNSS